MTISTTNYFNQVKSMGIEKLPSVLQQSHQLIADKTNDGKDWSLYKTDTDLKRMIDLVFKKLEEFIQSKKGKSIQGVDEDLDGNCLTPKDVAINLIKPSVLRGDTIDLHPANRLSVNHEDYAAHIQHENVVVTMLYGTKISESFSVDELMNEIVREDSKNKFPSKNTVKETPTRKKRVTYNHKQPEFRVLKAMLNWHNATVTKRMVEFFINELQGYIQTKKITKESLVANEIKLVQEKLLKLYNSMGEFAKVVLSPESKKIFQKALLKVTDINKLNQSPKKRGLDGIDKQPEIAVNKMFEQPKVNMMSSKEFTNLKFNTIGFKDKWLSFIGNPAPGFTAMVFGMPKMGKSYLCVDFAGYLARNHGNVLYVAKEEKLDKTLQDKINDMNVSHDNLTVADGIPDDLSQYDFIFLDSVNKLGLSSKDLETLKTKYKGKSFIYIFQATKSGKFKGNNEFQHDVDVVIEVPEIGKAIQYGRFNQGGEMNVFNNNNNNNSSSSSSTENDLSGIKPIKKKPLLNRLKLLK